jgi:heptaprenyl diphosphate synthase
VTGNSSDLRQLVASLPPQLRRINDRTLAMSLLEKLKLVESGIESAVSNLDPMIGEISSHLAKAGGKRLRPALLLLTAHLGDPERSELIDAAVVMEITHLGTLYHDDVMDQAPKRRGVDTAQVVWGNSLAILAGDLLFARASTLVSDLGSEALRLQAHTFERLVVGQFKETLGLREEKNSLDHYFAVLRDKTGSLIALSAQLGAMLAEAPNELQAPLSEFGEAIGVAFQLVDDIIDIASDDSDSGKEAGTDLAAGVSTLPLLLLESSADKADQTLLERIRATETRAQLTPLLAELRQHPVLNQAREVAVGWAERALAAIEPLPSGSVKSALEGFAEAVVERTA